MANDSKDVLARIEREKDAYLDELKEYLRFPSISTDPDYKRDVLRCAEWLRGKTVEAFGPECEIEVIPNFIDPSRYERSAGIRGARRWAKPREKVLVHISNFRPVKRVEDVVGVFHRVRSRMPARLLMVGDGPERAKVEQSCRDLGICQDLTFIGNLPLVEEVLIGADLFLLPSNAESFGLSALEALACKVPVVGYQAGGLPEVVSHGVDGFLLPVGDVAGMADAAVSLLADPERLAGFGEAGRARVVERFSQDRVVGQYRSLYESALA